MTRRIFLRPKMPSYWSHILHNPAAMTLVGVAFGALGTGFFLILNSWLTFRREERLRQKREKREALREINLGLEHYNMSMQALWPGALDAWLHQKKEPDLSYLPKGGKSLFDIYFLIGLYAPELQPDFKGIRDIADKFSQHWFRTITTSSIGQRDVGVVTAMNASLQELTASINSFRDKLIGYGSKTCA